MRIELTIKTSYLSTWSVWEGIRELVQNARDAEVQFSAPMRVAHEGNRLLIENEGCVLEHRALLLGHTSKAGQDGLIGQFGEGLKLGALALVREGHKVVIRTNGETWTPVLEKSELFEEDVLAFHIRKSREKEPFKGVRIEVQGISADIWSHLRRNIRFWSEDTNTIKTSSGTLLLSPEESGRLYVKGLFVEYVSTLRHGYDFRTADTDRDRKVVQSFDVTYYAARMWSEAIASRPDLVAEFLEALQDQAHDVRGFESGYAASDLSSGTKEKVAALFTEKYGEHALPVASLEESQKAEHLGLRGIVCSKAQRTVLESALGDRADVVKVRAQSVTLCGWGDLTAAEQRVLQDVIELTRATDIPVTLGDLDVVEFRDPALMGVYREERICIARSVLGDFAAALRTIVHESAHRSGSDGSKGHVDASEVALAKIAAFLWT